MDTDVHFSHASNAVACRTPGALSIREISEMDVERKILTEKTFLSDGVIFACETGSFRLDFGDEASLEISAGDILVLYPGSVVTIQACAPTNHYLSIALGDSLSAMDFFNSFAFYDRLVFRSDLRKATFDRLYQSFVASECHTPSGKSAVLSILADTLRSFQHELNQGEHRLFYEAVAQIHANLAAGIVRTDPLCATLQTSRSNLHKSFVAHCGIGPGAFIRREQLRLAKWYLTNTRKSIKEIAVLVGIPSAVYFTNFIRRMTGQTPSAFRKS